MKFPSVLCLSRALLRIIGTELFSVYVELIFKLLIWWIVLLDVTLLDLLCVTLLKRHSHYGEGSHNLLKGLLRIFTFVSHEVTLQFSYRLLACFTYSYFVWCWDLLSVVCCVSSNCRMTWRTFIPRMARVVYTVSCHGFRGPMTHCASLWFVLFCLLVLWWYLTWFHFSIA